MTNFRLCKSGRIVFSTANKALGQILFDFEFLFSETAVIGENTFCEGARFHYIDSHSNFLIVEFGSLFHNIDTNGDFRAVCILYFEVNGCKPVVGEDSTLVLSKVSENFVLFICNHFQLITLDKRVNYCVPCQGHTPAPQCRPWR